MSSRTRLLLQKARAQGLEQIREQPAEIQVQNHRKTKNNNCCQKVYEWVQNQQFTTPSPDTAEKYYYIPPDLPEDIHEFRSSCNGDFPKHSIQQDKDNFIFHTSEKKKCIDSDSNSMSIVSETILTDNTIEIPLQDKIELYTDDTLYSPSAKVPKISASKNIHVISDIELSSLQKIPYSEINITKDVTFSPLLETTIEHTVVDGEGRDFLEINVNSEEDEGSETDNLDKYNTHTSKDVDFNPNDYSENDSDEELDNSNITDTTVRPLSETLKINKNRMQKQVRCKFCQDDVTTKNFTRHLERRHALEDEVKKILNLPKNSKTRRQAFIYLRNSTNFDLFISGTTRPNRQRSITELDQNIEYYPCAYCKGLYMRQYLKRHANKCLLKPTENGNKMSHVSASQTLTACAMDVTNVISKLNIKEQVFNLMKGDDIAFEAKKDLLIANFGESYLKKHKRERMAYACSTRMRELARLLISYRKIFNNNKVSLKDLIVPGNFSSVVCAVRHVAGFDPVKKTFKIPSLAVHLGTSLKHASNELIHLVLSESPGFKATSADSKKQILTDAKHFIKLIETRWTIELASLASKDLQEKQMRKPLLLPLVSDVKHFREEALKFAETCKNSFLKNAADVNTYKMLSHCTLALLILFNRRRIGDVQYLKLQDYNCEKKTDFTDFQNTLTEYEKHLTMSYKRIVNTGKGSRPVVILVPTILQEYINILITHRPVFISSDNDYLFALPGSSIKWGKGDVAFRFLTTKMNLKYPQAIGSNKLRKHIATVMQLLNLSKSETKQLSTFMGHTEKTHEQFYEIPVDIYQTAKVSKLLLMMEKGTIPLQHKGKSLSEIDIDINGEVYPEEDEVKDVEDVPCSSKMILDDTFVSTNYASPQTHAHIETTKSDSECKINCLDPDEQSEEEINDKKDNKAKQKRSWTDKEVKLLKDTFLNHIEKNIYPSSQDIISFLEETNIKRTVPMIKAKLQQIIKKKNNKKC